MKREAVEGLSREVVIGQGLGGFDDVLFRMVRSVNLVSHDPLRQWPRDFGSEGALAVGESCQQGHAKYQFGRQDEPHGNFLRPIIIVKGVSRVILSDGDLLESIGWT